jgi:hypothetical protein
MRYHKPVLGLCFVLAWAAASAQAQLNQDQIQNIKDMAASICNTVSEAKGHKSDLQIQGDVTAKLGGLIGKVVDVGGSGKGSLSREDFEGLSRDATAAALEGDRGCRERVFTKMFDKLSYVPNNDPCAKERQQWEMTETVHSLQAYQYFLELYPRCMMGGLARTRIQQIQSGQKLYRCGSGNLKDYPVKIRDRGDPEYC